MIFLKPLLVALVGLVLVGCNLGNKDWRTASRESARIAPDPNETSDAIVHVYGADAWGWRGWFAIHTWIAAKRTDEDFYTIYDVVGWRGFNGQRVVGIRRDIPDRYWYGAEPQLLKAHRGPQVEALIDAIDEAALSSATHGRIRTRRTRDPTIIPLLRGSGNKCPNSNWICRFRRSAEVTSKRLILRAEIKRSAVPGGNDSQITSWLCGAWANLAKRIDLCIAVSPASPVCPAARISP